MRGWSYYLRIIHPPKHRVGIWYHREYQPKSLAGVTHLIGLVPNQIEQVIQYLTTRRILKKNEVQSSPIASYEELRLVHTEEYLQATMRPETITRIFGYEVNQAEADDLILAQRRSIGGTIAAAKAVVSGKYETALNLGGGFHHAKAEKGSGFCIFNDVAIAIRELRNSGFSDPIAIVDLDFHQGNGNLKIFADDPTVLTFSIQGATWSKRTAVSNEGILLPPGTDDETYLAKLRETLLPALKGHGTRLIFFIAGNDVLAGDRLGNFALTAKGVLERDRHVIDCAKEIRAPLVITLGGGYSPLSWQCTANLLMLLILGRASAPIDWEPELRRKFSSISRSIEAEESSSPENPLQFTESDILGDLSRLARPSQFLDYESNHAVEFALEKYGILPRIRSHGFRELEIETDASDPDRQVLRIYGKKKPAVSDSSIGSEQEQRLLLELVLHRAFIAAPNSENSPLQLLGVKWLLLQDPDTPFTQERPRLPGQDHPGLGIAEHVQEFLVQYCQRARLDGLLSTPSHYHNATVASRWAHFLQPEMEGRLLAFRQAVISFHVPEAASLIAQGALQLENGTPVNWIPSEQVLPVSPRLKAYFDSANYRNTAREECQKLLTLGLHVNKEKALGSTAEPWAE